MNIVDKRSTEGSTPKAGDILDISGYGLRMIIYDDDTSLYNTIDLKNGYVQLGSCIRSVEEVLDSYGLNFGRSYSIIRNDDIEIILKGRKGE